MPAGESSLMAIETAAVVIPGMPLMAFMTGIFSMAIGYLVAGDAGKFPMGPGQGKTGFRMILDRFCIPLHIPDDSLGSAGADLSRMAGGEEHPQD